ncbi:hypothetical protein BIV25_44910 [Streptomyces sp. MUSC 14]|uniref:carboxymuconolactone decarboxylase family protein n=1 Tax=Streptomyces sp. MUSC 14 TaxID=1354889 RepID=UPI0008F5A9D1|nr:carboxymuconolactone decarboxylase family protein [Streptomyces sp. MUSC 14]OIJ85092.1 hypothetical protein BIV25_44910 [Streptomyces sp. MUSC 14]
MTDHSAPRIPPLPFPEWGDTARTTLEANRDTPVLAQLLDGRPAPNVLATLARHDWLFGIATPFLASVTAGEMPPRDRELLILRTAHNTGSAYQWSHHHRLARATGLTEAEIDRVGQGPDAPGWSATEAALLRATDEIERDATVAEPTWQTLAAHYNRRQLLELLYLTGAFRLLATMLNSCRVPLDPWAAS